MLLFLLVETPQCSKMKQIVQILLSKDSKK